MQARGDDLNRVLVHGNDARLPVPISAFGLSQNKAEYGQHPIQSFVKVFLQHARFRQQNYFRQAGQLLTHLRGDHFRRDPFASQPIIVEHRDKDVSFSDALVQLAPPA